jgi:hypothetical protein
MARIKFIKPGWSSVFGAFSPGDLLACSDAEARHFVQDAGAAEYVGGSEPPAAEPAAEDPTPTDQRGRRAKK